MHSFKTVHGRVAARNVMVGRRVSKQRAHSPVHVELGRLWSVAPQLVWVWAWVCLWLCVAVLPWCDAGGRQLMCCPTPRGGGVQGHIQHAAWGCGLCGAVASTRGGSGSRALACTRAEVVAPKRQAGSTFGRVVLWCGTFAGVVVDTWWLGKQHCRGLTMPCKRVCTAAG